MSKDDLYVNLKAEPVPFVFDKQVADVFQDMIERSVPGYEMSLSMISLISRRYARSRTRGYDLGCSLGASSLALVWDHPKPDFSLVGVDNSADMLKRCTFNLEQANLPCEWELWWEDILDAPIENASIVVLNYTLQFIPCERRLELLKKIHAGLVPGGVLLVSEKMALAAPRMQKSMMDLHHDFKRANGYSNLEISRKRDALENVLIPETIEQHEDRLSKSGFTQVSQWFQCFNFASLVAFKD